MPILKKCSFFFALKGHIISSFKCWCNPNERTMGKLYGVAMLELLSLFFDSSVYNILYPIRMSCAKRADIRK